MTKKPNEARPPDQARDEAGSPDEARRSDDSPPPDDVRRKAIHQPKDKSAKDFYGDTDMRREFLERHLPKPLRSRVEIARTTDAPTEYFDAKHRIARHVDLAWMVPFRRADPHLPPGPDDWLYLLVLFEAQAKVDWTMPVRILLGVGLLYERALDNPDVQASRKLPPVLPIVVYVGAGKWDEATSLEELLPEEASSFLPLAFGSKFLVVSEEEEARSLARADTPRSAALKLRYPRSREEFMEVLETLKALLPADSPSRRALVTWVRSALIDSGGKEEEMAELQELDDLGTPAVEMFWDVERREARQKGHEEGREVGFREAEARALARQRATLARQAGRKFGAETAEALAALLEEVSDEDRLDAILDLVFDCDGGSELLARAAKV